jgi:ABC-type multidrug transport system ATPase subunit
MKAVEVENLVKKYPGGVLALNGVNLVVEDGVSHAILGPNGAGKTTLIRDYYNANQAYEGCS